MPEWTNNKILKYTPDTNYSCKGYIKGSEEVCI